MKTLLILSAILFISGCGQADRMGAVITGYSRACVDGVEYLQFSSGVTVAYSQDGKVKTCKN